MLERLKIFLKGMLMGLCDLVPGISGGTIAFITGIYERLINAIKSFSWPLLKNIVLSINNTKARKELRDNIKKLDLVFLLILILGIIVSLLLFSRAVSYLLDNYFSFTMIFFIGLILASARTIFRHIEKHHTTNTIIALVGLLVGISLIFLVPTQTEPTRPYIFIGGFVAVCAMILPGISGSFILLVMGLYQFMLNALENLEWGSITMFIIGAIAGLLIMSRAISYLLKKDKSKTLYFLLGLVVGALATPLKDVYMNFEPTTPSILIHFVLLCAGFAASHFIEVLARRR